jgi:hypothetical protein
MTWRHGRPIPLEPRPVATVVSLHGPYIAGCGTF